MNYIFNPAAKWISQGGRFVAESDTVGSPALYFCKKIFLRETADAHVIICGLGFFELYINSKKVYDRVLEPAFTQYDKRALYSEFSVSEYLCEQENTIEVILGDGWYNQTTRDTWGFYRAAWRDNPKFIFQLNAGDEIICSDESWRVGTGPIVSNAIRAGEKIDARKKVEYNAFAVVVAPPGGILAPQTMPPIRECEMLKPVREERQNGYVLYDFGKTIAGYCSAYLSGECGEEIEFVYSDRLTEGRCDNTSNSMYIFNPGLKYQTDTVILGDAEYFYKPKFVYHGFRYVEVRGNVRLRDIVAHFVHTDLERTGKFNCSDSLLNQLYAMSINAILGNYHGFPTDCPHREKNGWTGDGQLSAETCIYNFDMQEAYRKWLNDFADNQRESGQISAIIPSCGWGYNWGSGPAWDIALFTITRALWFYYKDIDTVRLMFPVIEKYLAYAKQYENADGLVCYGLGDWNYPKNISFKVCPTELTDSCYYSQMLTIASEFAAMCLPAHEKEYQARAERVRGAIAQKYAYEDSLTGMAALTAFQIVDRSKDIADYLEKNNYVLHCGILGTRFLLLSLLQMRRSDIAYRILTRTEYPSFGYWILHGQTSLCEDFELTNSLNHHMYSCITEYMMKGICGIQLESGSDSVLIAPDIPEEVSRFECTVAGMSLTYNANHVKRFCIDMPEGKRGRLRYGGKEISFGGGTHIFEY